MGQDTNRTAIDRYLDSLLTQRKLSPHTLAGYRKDLEQLAELADSAELTALPHIRVRHFAAKLHAQGLNPRSIARKLSAWRGFYKWLAEHDGISANPVDGIKPPRRSRPLPKALSVDDAVRLMADASGTETPSDTQSTAKSCDRAMFELLYSSGLRVSELVALDVRHIKRPGYASQGWIDLDACELTVTGKGGKTRLVPVGRHASEAIAAWLAVREQSGEESSESDRFALFLGARGRRITPRAVQLRLKAHAQALGIPANVHPHVLRHSFASHVLQSSGDLRAVQEMLGHSSIASTQIYTALDFQHLAKIYDAAHPRAKPK